MMRNGEAVMENVRRYRTIACLYRQTAAFRPHQRESLLAQAAEWESRAVAELEAHFIARQASPQAPANTNYHAAASAPARWQVAVA